MSNDLETYNRGARAAGGLSLGIGHWSFVGHWCLVIAILLCSTQSTFADLRVLDTPHYRIHTDLEQRLAEDLGVRMESMYAEYSVRLADFNPSSERRLEVYLFKDRKDYATFTGDSFTNTGGIFIPKRNLLAAFLEPQGRDGLHRTLQHEAFHQFAFLAIGTELPIWLNEGIAQVFEEGIWTGRQFMLGQVPPRRIRQLKQDIADQRIVSFQNFLATTDAQWRAGLRDENTGAAQYNQAWAMTHFLIYATDDAGKPKYRARLINMLKLIHAGTNGHTAFNSAFSDNFEGFQQRFMEYANSLKPTREANFAEHQGVLADMLVLLNNEGKRFKDVESFRKLMTDGGYRLKYSKGSVQWSTESDPAAYFKDAAGRTMNSQQLYFSPRAGAPLPDIVCEPAEGLRLRTVFHDGTNNTIDHETNIER